jgi:hypothetical protein
MDHIVYAILLDDPLEVLVVHHIGHARDHLIHKFASSDHCHSLLIVHHWGTFADSDGLVTVHTNDESGTHGTAFTEEGVHVTVVHHVKGAIHEDTDLFAVFGVGDVLEVEKLFFEIVNDAMSLAERQRERDRQRERERDRDRQTER